MLIILIISELLELAYYQMGHGKLDSNSELDCTKSEKVKPGQNTEHPAVSPVL